jgi:membrane-associated phospholipid phosphatase
MGRAPSSGKTRQVRDLVFRVLGPVSLWIAYAVLLLPYVFIRGVCDEVFAARDIESWEQAAFFGSVPTSFLQDHLGGGFFWNLGFAVHLSWFFLPLVWGLVVVGIERRRLPEYFMWLLLASYLSTVSFFLLPVEPPWMQDGVVRILVEHGPVDYAGVDDNQVASLPSLHAGLPIVVALFFWIRLERRGLAALIAAHGLLIGLGVVYLGEHWMIDVVAGWALAATVAWLCTADTLRIGLARLDVGPLRSLQRAVVRLSALGVHPGSGPWGSSSHDRDLAA